MSGYINLLVGSHSTYEEGDIIGACNGLTIRRSAAFRICGERIANRQFAGLNGSGFLPHSHILKDWHEACCEYRIERLNASQCRMTRISDSTELVITSGVPHTDLRGKPDRVMNVEQYFTRRLASFKKQNAQGKAIFSDDGDENTITMYGGRTNADTTAMNAVWTAIETKTPKTEAAETAYDKEPPFGAHRKRLVLRVDDFDDTVAGQLMLPLTDNADPPVTLKKRKNLVAWRTDLALSGAVIAAIDNDAREVDLRGVELVRANIVTVKT